MKMKNKLWKVLSRKTVYDGSPYLKISIDTIELPNGKIINDYHRIDIEDAVMLIVENDKKELLVYKEYRHGIGDISLTFPAGGIENEEDLFDAAKRELLEETGYLANTYKLISNYKVSGSYMFSNLSFIKVSDILKSVEPIEKDMENPDILWLSKQDVKLAIKNNEFKGLTYATAALHWILDEKIK